MNSKYAIVVIGYNRLNSIKRLLKSLENAEYGSDKVDLIISIDNSGSNEIENYANSFSWKFGEKTIKTYPERLGLRNHILKCGKIVYNYDAIIVLEDDVVVAPGFYNYTKQVVPYYKDNRNIAGISLYSHSWNVCANNFFCPETSNSDVFFIQFPQSWGQIWMKNQWIDFEKWYENHQDDLLESEEVPKCVSNWPNSSWLKYHVKYCIDTNKYFVYPYKSLSTCFSEVGEHCKIKNTLYQVPISNETDNYYVFVDIEDGNKYDAFFEREKLGKYLGIRDEELCVDIYGIKPVPKKNEKIRYMLTTQNLNYKIIKSYGLDMKPHENNILWNIKGNIINLYDLKYSDNNKFDKNKDIEKYVYYQRIHGNSKKLVSLIIFKIKEKITKVLIK